MTNQPETVAEVWTRVATEAASERAQPPLCIRRGTMADLPYCEDTWSKAAVKDRGGPLGERWVRVDGGRLLLSPKAWHEMQREHIKATLGRSGVLVGHRADAPDVVWCWLAWDVAAIEGTVNEVSITLHYAWTRPELRRRGYASALYQSAMRRSGIDVIRRVRCSHMTPAGEALFAKVHP